jgi:hypothetical protein
VVTVKKPSDVAEMYELGATFVIVPNILGGEHFAQLLKTKKTRKSSWGSAARKQKRELGMRAH